MKRIRIATIFEAINYGAVLQAYALNDVVKKLRPDADVKVINYRPSFTKNDLRVIRMGSRNPIKCVLRIMSDMLFCCERIKKLEKFKEFRKNYLDLTQDTDIDEFRKAEFDCYISGSDQIWNPMITDNSVNAVYFGDFDRKDVCRISYASSMGAYAINDQHRERILELLDKFDYLSVREQSTANVLGMSLRRKIDTVLDPTLLLSENEWRERFSISGNKSKRKYVLIYSVAGIKKSKILIDIARRIADERQAEIIMIGGEMIVKGVRLIRSASPVEFIEYIANAEVVITNSFHGTAFSITFHKKFISCSNYSSPIRCKNLLDSVGLSQNFVEDNGGYIDLKVCEVDYEQADQYLSELRKNSVCYLENALRRSERAEYN